jgi:hypothetical protein
MVGIESFGELYAKICHEWNKAEEDIKRAEQVCEEVIIPSVMELRYAGRRLAQALEIAATSGDFQEVEKLLNEACFFCHRARHDAIDAATAQIAKTLSIAVGRLHYTAILSAFPAFPELRRHVQRIRDKIVVTRGTAVKRDEVYEYVESSDFPALLQLFAEFQSNEPMMQSMAKRERRERLITWIALATASLALIGEAVHFFL